MIAIITVLDSISHTTMPYNEFIMYRDSVYENEKQIVFLTGNEIAIPEENIPNSLEIHRVGKNPFKIRREIIKVKKELSKKNIKCVIHLHSIRGSFSTLLSLIGTRLRVNTVYTIHSTYSGYKAHNKILSVFDALLSNYVTFVSDTSYSAFPNIIKKIKKGRLRVIHNGVNTDRIDRSVKNKADTRLSEGIICVYVARIIPLKNHIFLVELLKKLNRNVKFVFVGLEEIPSAREKAIALGVDDRIVFTGLISREEVYNILLNADLYISSSTLEGLPVSVLEGMYCGLPVIMSNIPQHREVAIGSEGAKLLDLEIDEWSKEINSFASIPMDIRKEMGEKCKAHVYNNFSLSKMHEKYDMLYEKIINQQVT